jgi:pentapeptide repeat protein
LPDPPERRGSSSGSGAIHPSVLILIGVLAVGLAVLGWVLAPGWVSPPIAPESPLAQVVADEASRRAAVSATRAALVTGLLGVGALLALWINNATARAALTNARAALTNAEVAVTNSRVAVETLRVAERGHLTDRYAKAIEQLGDDKLAVRLGGIYGLQQYAEDSDRPGDQRTVVEVLSAFIRDKLAGVGGSDGTHEPPGADVLAAVSVLAQLPPREGIARAYFPGALFHSVGIRGARLTGGNLSGVRMDAVGIRSADMSNINLDGANFDNASLTRCDLTGASLRGTIFRTGQLSYSKLHDADLEGADLGTVTCEETEFNRANLRNATSVTPT